LKKEQTIDLYIFDIFIIFGRQLVPPKKLPIKKAFAADNKDDRTILTGFGHNAVMSVADKVIEAVKSGAIKHFYLIGGFNDAYSKIKIASALAEAFEAGVNDLPLSFIMSWYEQKPVAILLTLLYLDIKNFKLGPTLPIFLEPNVLNLLVEKYGIAPIGTVEEDLAATLA
jgi:hydroxylamine reductase